MSLIGLFENHIHYDFIDFSTISLYSGNIVAEYSLPNDSKNNVSSIAVSKCAIFFGTLITAGASITRDDFLPVSTSVSWYLTLPETR